MSTNGMTSWAVDLNTVGAIYPFQGTEALLVILLLIFWVGWHVLQHRVERREFDHEVAASKKSGDKVQKAIERY